MSTSFSMLKKSWKYSEKKKSVLGLENACTEVLEVSYLRLSEIKPGMILLINTALWIRHQMLNALWTGHQMLFNLAENGMRGCLNS